MKKEFKELLVKEFDRELEEDFEERDETEILEEQLTSYKKLEESGEDSYWFYCKHMLFYIAA